jgi:hypothetical protein
MVESEQRGVNLFQAYNKHAFNNPFQPHLDNPMKKLLIFALALAPAVVSAQETANVTVSTTIRDAFALTKVDDLVFGQVQAGDVVSVTSTTNALSNTGSSGKRAVITSTAASATVYTVDGPGIADALTANPTIDLPIDGAVGSAQATIEVTLNFAVDSASPTAYTPGTTTGASNTAGNTLYVGGSFTAPTGDSIGRTYTGSITISAVYL